MIQPTEENRSGTKSPLSEAQLGHFRELLIEERGKVQSSLVRLQQGAVQDNPDNLGDALVRTHLADLGSETFEQEETFGLVEQFSEVLTAIDRALERLEEGQYEICENCGNAIPVERLEAIPYATRCAACQNRAESGEDLG
jgi:RNA polymerase-binding protein DksA